MSAIVDYRFYADTYIGKEADEASFPALYARASDAVGAMTRWKVTANTIGDLPELVQTLYKKAICAQVDYFAVNGLDIVAAGANASEGFTVGKVSVHGGGGVGASAMADHIAPLARMYLEQTGLLNAAVPVGPLYTEVDGWWL